MNFLSKFRQKNPKLSLQLGGFFSHQGRAQNVDIEGLVGDHFSVTQHNSGNGLVGVGYYIDGVDKEKFTLTYGINALYLAGTSVHGQVVQEQLFTNLGYGYNVTNYPIYAAVKAAIKNSFSDKYHVMLDLGIGPNIIHTTPVYESSLDSVSIPDYMFAGNTSVAFSAMAGIGVKVNDFFGKAPLECGYRFLYLGQGNFTKTTPQVLSTLNTGQGYANALLCSITV